MKYLAVLGRQPKLSLAELESLFTAVEPVGSTLAKFENGWRPHIRRLGGCQKIAEEISEPIVDYLKKLPKDKKITLGISDFTPKSSAETASREALKLKRILKKLGYSVRVVPNKTAVLSSATSYHNHLFHENKLELIKTRAGYYRVIGVQDIDEYVQRDRERPARDAKVGMLPPKLAQILINLCGNLTTGARLLDPFCGTGVVLQEAALAGYVPYGTDLSERMVQYSERNLEWLKKQKRYMTKVFPKDRAESELEAKNDRFRGENVVKFTTLLEKAVIEPGDAQHFIWNPPIDAVAGEGYLGKPMSAAPSEMTLKTEKQECGAILRGFLRNLSAQIQPRTPVAIAVPAWLRPDGKYESLNLLDEIDELGYNVRSFKNLSPRDLLYYRDGQVVAREIIVLRKE